MKLLLLIILLLVNLLYIPLNRQVAKFSFKIRFDGLTPLLPWTIWVYASFYILYPLSILVLWNSPFAVPFLVTLILSTTLASLIWKIFPNGVVRPNLDSSAGGYHHRLLRLLYLHDRDCNGLPSGHVMHSFIFCFYLAKEFPPVWPIFVVILLAISLSTLTTKQHYFLDMVCTLCLTPLLIELTRLLL